MGRHCEDEMHAIERFSSLKEALEELYAHKAALEASGRPTEGVERKIAKRKEEQAAVKQVVAAHLLHHCCNVHSGYCCNVHSGIAQSPQLPRCDLLLLLTADWCRSHHYCCCFDCCCCCCSRS